MLEQREHEFENRFSHDQELRFRIAARRNRLVGEWAGHELGMSDKERHSYGQELVSVRYLGPQERALFDKIRADFDSGGVEMSDHRIERHIAEALATAEQQITD